MPLLPALCGEAKNAAPANELGAKLEPFLSCLNGKESRYQLRIEVSGPIEGRDEAAKIRLSRFDDESFLLEIEHKEYPLRLERTSDRTTLILPARKAAFTGTGPLEGEETLKPLGIAARLVSEGTAAYPYMLVLSSSSAQVSAGLLTGLAGLKSEDGAAWTSSLAKESKLTFSADPPAFEASAGKVRMKVERAPESGKALEPFVLPDDFKVKTQNRADIEKLLLRGARRALEVLSPSALLIQPIREARNVPNGELRWVEDQRLVSLKGTPQEVGLAHGRLLREEARRCLDSVVYLIGAAQTVRTGRWFLDDLREAYGRLEKFIPQDHKTEVEALAEGAGLGKEEARLANVFPELFHCSGFALFGKATVGGKLYHGRVLDYMTAIGLQDSAGTFVVSVKGKIPFVSVGYAGFVGSVSGMNARQVSIGEMGGRGEGQWDGVPMADLLRRALEECSTLAEVKKLWTDSPRTCEYFYVFADGKIPDALGVGATPGKIEFVKPGESHPLLGDGIPDAVLMSGGERLKLLRERVRENHGKIDAEKAMWLMSRPVAMSSNLHNVLFVPQDLVLYVAHADRKAIAAKRPYVRFDLGALLNGHPE